MKELLLKRLLYRNQQSFYEIILKTNTLNSSPTRKYYKNTRQYEKIDLCRHHINKKDFNFSKRFLSIKIKTNNKREEYQSDLFESNKKIENDLIQKNKSNQNILENKDKNKLENIIDFNEPNSNEVGTNSLLDNEWKPIKIEFKKLPGYYSKLSKRNLSALVVATTMMGCIMAPVPFDPNILFLTTIGTSLTSASANAYNQFLEVPYDSQMNRTKDRVLVRGDLTPLHGFTFATVTGIVGVSTLYFYANPLTAFLGATTLLLYTLVYTPMKRMSPLNTWIGSIVGAIPPLMGWTAMTGQIDSAGLLLALILYSWQFPHFHALSWNLRAEYTRAGYRMISVLNPRICTSSTVNHTLALTLICSYLAPVLELTTWNFAIDSLPFNLYFIYLANQFKIKQDAQSARKVFRYSLLYLPFIILLLFITKYPIDSHTQNDDTSLIKLFETRLEHLKKNSRAEYSKITKNN